MDYLKYIIVMFITGGIVMAPLSIGYSNGNTMQVHFIDVGQGDSILIETPGKKTILIDGGPPEAGKKVVNYIKERNIDQIDLLIATHPDVDHIGGLIDVLKQIEVKEVLGSGKRYTTKTYRTYLEQIRMQNIPFSFALENEFIRLDPLLTIQVLNAKAALNNNNQGSTVLKITYADIKFLFMADVGKGQERHMLKRYDLKADILKVAHHGSKTSSSIEFLQAVQPQIALLTYQKGNRYGHPVSKVITNLNQIKADLYSTAMFGNVRMQTNGENIFLMFEKSPLESITEERD